MEALDDYLSSASGNPCIVIPTAGGKTPTMAWTLKRYYDGHPGFRACVLAHVSELLEQGVEKIKTIWPLAPVGVYSASLKRRDKREPITYAGIQSVYDKACDFDPFDIIFVDEAHHISLKDAGQYRQFIRDAKLCNPNLRVVGWTATAYRMDGGKICHPDFILNEIAYEANVKDLIAAGHLCKLRTKLGAHGINTAGIKRSAGDFNKKQLEAAAMPDETVDGIASELAGILDRENRQSVIVFCVSVDHAEKMSRALAARGIDAPTIHQGTPSQIRTHRGDAFKRGEIRALVNVNVLSEGFDAQRVDCVAMIRPTQSKGMYYQQVGRGLRIHESKSDCLILDFAGNILRHGPIDRLEGEVTQTMTCPQCRERFAVILGKCPGCDYVIPPPTQAEIEAAERSARIIPSDPKARVEVPIISDGKPWEMPVEDVQVSVHRKANKPPILCVNYSNKMQSHREWVCLEHDGYAGKKARDWWRMRFGEPVPKTADEAIKVDLFLADHIKQISESIQVKNDGRYTNVVGVKLRSFGRKVG
jgi:DNA repair protein RadD